MTSISCEECWQISKEIYDSWMAVNAAMSAPLDEDTTFKQREARIEAAKTRRNRVMQAKTQHQMETGHAVPKFTGDH